MEFIQAQRGKESCVRSHSQLTELGFDPQQPDSSILNLFLLLLISVPWVPSPVSPHVLICLNGTAQPVIPLSPCSLPQA